MYDYMYNKHVATSEEHTCTDDTYIIHMYVLHRLAMYIRVANIAR